MKSHIRNPGFPEHYKEVIIELYSKYDDILVDSVGYTVEEGVAICEALVHVMNSKVSASKSIIDEKARKLRNEIIFFHYRTLFISWYSVSVSKVQSIHSLRSTNTSRKRFPNENRLKSHRSVRCTLA